ncbi:DNA ligase 1 [Podosphaera aphanis]|nr:DNA ligase 1 [Podosphaera aphanis]
MPPKQATLGIVKDSQTTLGKDVTKTPSKQTKLAFLSKPPTKQDESESSKDVHIVHKKDRGSDAKEYKRLGTKKRPRSPGKKSPVGKENPNQSNVDEDADEDEIRSVKRLRSVKGETDNNDSTLISKTNIKIKDEGKKTPKDSRKPRTPERDNITVKKEEVAKYSVNSPTSKSPKHRNKTIKRDKAENGCEHQTGKHLEVSSEKTEKKNSSVGSPLSIKKQEDDDDESSHETANLTATSTNKGSSVEWKSGDPVPYAALCETFSLIEMTSKRLVITSYCSLFLLKVLKLTPNDLLPVLLLMVNKLAADYAGIELGIGESLIMKAIGESTGRSLATIKEHQKQIGDLGLVSVMSRARQPTMFSPKPLTVRGVHRALIEIATISGQGAQTRKVDLIKKLLSAADTRSSGAKVDVTKDKGGASEAKFIVRFLEGKLRLGLAERTVLISLAHAIVCHEVDSKKAGKSPSPEELAKGVSILKAVYSELPSYEIIIPILIKHGISHLREKCKLRPGVPLKPMLAKPTKAITEVLDRFEGQNFTCEYKYDGERAQIHYVAKNSPVKYLGPTSATSKTNSGGFAAVFSRNSEDLSKKYPDILDKLDAWVKPTTNSFVLDCESVAWDRVEKKVLPFQQLMTRKKKDVKAEDVKVKVCVFAFDLLHLNGEAVVQKPFRERRELLHSAFFPVQDEFAFATGMDGQELDEIQVFLDESMKASCEGLMVKMLDGPESSYEPSKRSQNWLKIKKDYLSGIGDSLDLVVLGAYYGKGKRTSVYGAFLLACHNSSTDSYETVCNIGTGFTEVVLGELFEQLSAIVIDRPKPFYDHASSGPHQPDVWFEPKYVWEVKTADLTLSPRYKAGCKEGVDGNKGISLRFPRFIKVRDDKKPEMATTSRQVVEMYRKQENVAKNQKPAVDDDFEY